MMLLSWPIARADGQKQCEKSHHGLKKCLARKAILHILRHGLQNFMNVLDLSSITAVVKVHCQLSVQYRRQAETFLNQSHKIRCVSQKLFGLLMQSSHNAGIFPALTGSHRIHYISMRLSPGLRKTSQANGARSSAG